MAPPGPTALPPLHGHACPLHRGQRGHPHSGVPSAGTGEAVLQEAAAGREAVQPSGGGNFLKLFSEGFETETSKIFF